MAITDSIGMATDRLESIVRAMLDLSTIETDALELFLEQTTLKSVVQMALEPWMKPIRLRRLNLTVEGVEDIPPIVVDPQRLGQAFGNLISNAIKYTPDGGSIAIRARQTDEAHFEVVVADTGVGIDPSDHELVFDKFFRVGNSDQHSSSQFKFKGAGPGLGLSIVRGVVEAHGGRTWVVSEGCDEIRCPGSAFHVALPLRAYPSVVRKGETAPSVDGSEAAPSPMKGSSAAPSPMKGSEAAPSLMKGSSAASSNAEGLKPDTKAKADRNHPKVVSSDYASSA